MPLLGALITTLFGSIASFLVAMLGKKLATATAAVAALGVVTGVLLAAFRTIVSPLVARLFATQFGSFLGLAFPPIAGDCIAAISLTWAACALYKWQVKAIQLSASA